MHFVLYADGDLLIDPRKTETGNKLLFPVSAFWALLKIAAFLSIMKYGEKRKLSVKMKEALMQLKGLLLLLGAAFIWGTTFVAQMVGMDGLGPFTYAMSRYLLGLLFLIGLWYAFGRKRAEAKAQGLYHPGWRAGFGAGMIMLVGTSLQQVAMQYTTAGKTAFITALYIILVPLGAAVLGKKIHGENWVGAVVALVGLYLLSIHGETSLGLGDALVLVSSWFWAGQILFIDRYADRVDAIELSVAQLFVCWVGSTIAAALFEEIRWEPILAAWIAIFYGGVMSGGVAFTLQIIGQKYAEPGPAAIIMSFEAVFGVISSWLLLGEVMSTMQIIGCSLMMAGVIITQSRMLIKRKAGKARKTANVHLADREGKENG